MEQQEISFIAGGNANGTAILRDSLVLLTKLNILLYNPAIVLLWYLSKGVENLTSTQKTYTWI